MGETWSEIPETLIEWIKKQHMFWVASAPLSPDGHVNISPKGVAGTFHVESPTRVWYEDLSGSGAETIAHIRENGRITILFNAFDGPPRITRLYGIGSFYELGTPQYDALLPPGSRQPGSRAVVVVDVYKVGTTCGYSVPYYSFVGHRTPLLDWAARKEAIDLASSKPTVRPPPQDPSLVPASPAAGSSPSDLPGPQSLSDSIAEPHPNGLLAWWRDRNTFSLDGLPALSLAFRQPASSLGSHQPVCKASYSALNQYPPSKQPVDDVPPTASDIRNGRSLDRPPWLASLVRWFLPIHLFASFLAFFTTFAGVLLARSSAKSIPTTRTLIVHGERIHESPPEAPQVESIPVPWVVKHNGVSASRSVASHISPTSTTPLEPHLWGPVHKTAGPFPSMAVLLGYGLSFLLGMMFMMLCSEVQTSASQTHAAALLFRGRRLFGAFSA